MVNGNQFRYQSSVNPGEAPITTPSDRSFEEIGRLCAIVDEVLMNFVVRCFSFDLRRSTRERRSTRAYHRIFKPDGRYSLPLNRRYING